MHVYWWHARKWTQYIYTKLPILIVINASTTFEKYNYGLNKLLLHISFIFTFK